MVMMMIWFIKFLMETTIPLFSLLCSIVIFWASVFLYGIFDRNYSSYQFVFMKIYGGNNLSTSCVGFGIDGLSMVFILLTAFIFILIFMSAWKYNLKYVNEYCLAFLGIEFFLIMAFLS